MVLIHEKSARCTGAFQRYFYVILFDREPKHAGFITLAQP